jgi:uncharacterized protein (TIGR02996 family)
VASLLVYLEAARLDELLPEFAAGDTWLLGPETFAQPQLERLDEQSWLFIVSGTRCIAVLRNPRIHDGAFMGGAALISNKDISHVLPRLGCTDGNVAAWAAIPRVLPPSDLDLLRYELGIADEEDIDDVLPDDDRTRELRAAVFDDPLSDDARMVYADYLQDRGDPRGELVALQVSRARSGDFQSDRERLLVRRISPDCAQPLTPYLVPGFELVRGFVGKCTVNDTPMPEAITWHQAWRTVDDLTTKNIDLLVSPHVRARRIGTGGRQLLLLVDHMRPLPFETVVGIAPYGKSQRGVWIEEAGWDRVAANVGALENVTTISVNPELSGLGPRLIPLMLRGPIGQRLRHIDAFIELQFADAQRCRDAFDFGRAALLTMRFELGARPQRGPEVLVGLRRTARLPHLIVQVADALDAEQVTTVMRFVAQLSRNLQYAELHDFGARRGQRIEDRNALMLERMNAMFTQVLVQPATARPLAP